MARKTERQDKMAPQHRYSGPWSVSVYASKTTLNSCTAKPPKDQLLLDIQLKFRLSNLKYVQPLFQVTHFLLDFSQLGLALELQQIICAKFSRDVTL